MRIFVILSELNCLDPFPQLVDLCLLIVRERRVAGELGIRQRHPHPNARRLTGRRFMLASDAELKGARLREDHDGRLARETARARGRPGGMAMELERSPKRFCQ
jgi:hypothetical protein